MINSTYKGKKLLIPENKKDKEILEQRRKEELYCDENYLKSRKRFQEVFLLALKYNV